jgi:ABC-type Na+ efflux pump permease subunit
MPAATLARFVLLDTLRGGLPWLAAASILAGLVLAAFLSQLALTESVFLQTAIMAALLRFCAVFLLATQVTSSTLREIDDKGLELMLSLPLPRTVHYLGRLAGFALSGIILAAAFSVPLLFWVSPAAAAHWGASLALELVLVAAASLFFAMTLARLVPALAAVAGLYLLARSIGAIQAIASGPLASTTLPEKLAHWAIDAISLLLPRLDLATRTEWLLYGTPSAAGYAAAMAGLAIYAALLTGAGLFDFHRRSL